MATPSDPHDEFTKWRHDFWVTWSELRWHSDSARWGLLGLFNKDVQLGPNSDSANPFSRPNAEMTIGKAAHVWRQQLESHIEAARSLPLEFATSFAAVIGVFPNIIVELEIVQRWYDHSTSPLFGSLIVPTARDYRPSQLVDCCYHVLQHFPKGKNIELPDGRGADGQITIREAINWFRRIAAQPSEPDSNEPIPNAPTHAENQTIAPWSQSMLDRNKWLWEQCDKGTPYKQVIAELKNKVAQNGWDAIDWINGVKKAANAYGQRYLGKSLPNRKRGRPRGQK